MAALRIPDRRPSVYGREVAKINFLGARRLVGLPSRRTRLVARSLSQNGYGNKLHV